MAHLCGGVPVRNWNLLNNIPTAHPAHSDATEWEAGRHCRSWGEGGQDRGRDGHFSPSGLIWQSYGGGFGVLGPIRDLWTPPHTHTHCWVYRVPVLRLQSPNSPNVLMRGVPCSLVVVVVVGAGGNVQLREWSPIKRSISRVLLSASPSSCSRVASVVG